VKALTLTQPWASLVALGEKQFETRSWSTPYRGPLAIHAAKGVTPIGGTEAFYDLCAREPFHTCLFDLGRYALPTHLPRGDVVAIANLVDVVPTADFALGAASRCEASFGDYSLGRFAWVLTDVQRLVNPPAARGRQQLWDWGNLLDDVLELLDSPAADNPGRWTCTMLADLLGVSELEVEAALSALLDANLCGEEPAGYFFTDPRDPECARRTLMNKMVPA